MRHFLIFVALLAGSLLIAAALTYPAWWLVSLISIEPVHRVMNRVAMLIALIGLVVLTRRLGLSDRESMGYGIPRREFIRTLILGWVCGIGLMLPLVTMLLGLDIRVVREEFSGHLPDLLGVALAGLISGLIVAFIEETFFRGVLFTATARTSGTIAAVVAPSLLYAALHFLGGKLRVAPEDVGWHHGFAVLARLFERYTQPLAFADSFLALFALGVLLALVRLRTGSIAACIGLHAAGVGVIAVLRESTRIAGNAVYAPLVGSYDGVIGWGAFAWFVAILLVYLRFGKRFATR